MAAEGAERPHPREPDRGADDPASPSPARLWLASLLLVLPATWPYLLHYLHAGDRIALGFIHDDMASYMAHAREYFDGAGLTYGNPFSPFYDTPSIYFQPWTLLLGAIWRTTGIDQGIIFVTFGAIAAIVCTRLAIEIYRQIVGLRSIAEWMGLVAFVWGGGVLVLAGFTYITITGNEPLSVLRFDPDGGWWFLNFGRNFVYPTEAFFHALFLGCILAVYRKRFGVALLLAFLTSISHPFTGVKLLLILTVWSFVEWYFLRGGELRRSFVLACWALLALHVAYYLGVLNQFPEHRSLVEQWARPWVYHARNFVPAYALVGGLTLWRMRRIGLARQVLGSSGNRLLLVWFAVSFALANHEFAMRPVQPLHFTRGYVWMPLFLLGAPVLVTQLARLWSSRQRVLGVVCCAAVVGLFVSDNVVWLAQLSGPIGMYQTEDQRELMDWLNREEHRGRVVLAGWDFIGYMTTVYTPLRAWRSHHLNTPFTYERRQEKLEFFQDGAFLETWRDMTLLIVYSHDDPVEPGHGIPADLQAQVRFRNQSFTVLEAGGSGADPR